MAVKNEDKGAKATVKGLAKRCKACLKLYNLCYLIKLSESE